MRNAFEPLSIMSITWDEGRLRFREPLKAIAREKYGAPYMTAHRADLHNLLRRAIGDTPLHARRQLRRRRHGERHRGGALCRRHDGRSRYRHRRRRHPLRDPRAAFRRRPAALHRDDGLARIVPMDCVPTRVGPGGSVSARTRRIFRLDRAERPRHLLSDRRQRRQAQHFRRPRHRTMGRGILVGAVEPRGTDRRQGRLERGAARKCSATSSTSSNGASTTAIRCRNGRHGRVTLLGDAAHPTMPTLAQGANMAIEDGYVLARLLSRHGEDIETALQAYLAERQPRTDWVTLKSREQFANNRKALAAAVRRSHLAVRQRRHPGGGGAAAGLKRLPA